MHVDPEIFFSQIGTFLGWYYLSASVRFARAPDDQTARQLLKTSVLYLPLYMLILVVANMA